MKIKRFEASSMSEALRNIKKEFGEEAVILSAKTIKKSGLLGKKKSEQVVVTAAIDKMAPGKDAMDAAAVKIPTLQQSEGPATGSETSGFGGINILKKFNPITLTGQRKVKPKIVQLMSATQEQNERSGFFHLLAKQGFNENIAADLERKCAAILPENDISEKDYRSALAQVLEAKGVIGRSANSARSGQRVVVMLGPSGVGKTSAAAKLAAKHILHFNQSVALVSFDNQRVAGTAELERYARILGAPSRFVFDAGELKSTMAELASYDLVVVDTPGLAADDYILCEHVRRIVTGLHEPEPYLLLSADMQEKTMARVISFYQPYGVQRLFFTRLDWTEDFGPMINQVLESGLPVGYISDSPKVPDGIHIASAEDMAGRIIPETDTGLAENEDDTVTVIKTAGQNLIGNYYVANRNSDIFHLNECKSVKRINTENMIVFKDPAEAMGRRFKPCRMCCSELILSRTTDRLARGYAGNRY